MHAQRPACNIRQHLTRIHSGLNAEMLLIFVDLRVPEGQIVFNDGQLGLKLLQAYLHYDDAILGSRQRLDARLRLIRAYDHFEILLEAADVVN